MKRVKKKKNETRSIMIVSEDVFNRFSTETLQKYHESVTKNDEYTEKATLDEYELSSIENTLKSSKNKCSSLDDDVDVVSDRSKGLFNMEKSKIMEASTSKIETDEYEPVETSVDVFVNKFDSKTNKKNQEEIVRQKLTESWLKNEGNQHEVNVSKDVRNNSATTTNDTFNKPNSNVKIIKTGAFQKILPKKISKLGWKTKENDIECNTNKTDSLVLKTAIDNTNTEVADVIEAQSASEPKDKSLAFWCKTRGIDFTHRHIPIALKKTFSPVNDFPKVTKNIFDKTKYISNLKNIQMVFPEMALPIISQPCSKTEENDIKCNTNKNESIVSTTITENLFNYRNTDIVEAQSEPEITYKSLEMCWKTKENYLRHNRNESIVSKEINSNQSKTTDSEKVTENIHQKKFSNVKFIRTGVPQMQIGIKLSNPCRKTEERDIIKTTMNNLHNDMNTKLKIQPEKSHKTLDFGCQTEKNNTECDINENKTKDIEKIKPNGSLFEKQRGGKLHSYILPTNQVIQKIEINSNDNSIKNIPTNRPLSLIVSSKSGKKITLKPKTPPVYLNKDKFVPPKTKRNVCIGTKTKQCHDSSVQTDSKTFSNKSIQTEHYDIPFENLNSDNYDMPDIKDLVEFILATPRYSGDLDESKKNDLLDLSKNVSENIRNSAASKNLKNTVSQINVHRELKHQFFLDLRDCISYDCAGNMPIHNTILENDLKLMLRQMLVLRIRKISINVPNSQGITPIQMAIMNDSHIPIISKLLEKEADTNVVDDDGNTLLHLTVMHSNELVLQLVLSNLKSRKMIDFSNDDGVTPLMLSTITKKTGMVEVLLKNGANPNIRDKKSGRTALFHAVENESDFIINLLLSNKADPKINNFLGVNPIDAAKDMSCGQNLLLDDNDTEGESAIVKPIKKRKTEEKQNRNKKKIMIVASLKKIDPLLLQKSS